MGQELLKKIADRMAFCNDKSWEMDIEHFDWGPGVGLYGIWKVYDITSEEKYRNFLIRWADIHIADAAKKRTINSVAPCLTLWELYKETGKEEYGDVCKDMVNYLRNEAPLTVDGGLEHTVTENVPEMKDQMWADTLFMAVIFMARFGRDTGNEEISTFATKQLLLHYRVLWDPDIHLFYHGWNGCRKNHMSGVHWGRANAWILISSLEILEAQPHMEGRQEVISIVKQHMEALISLQRENGMFGTILDDTESYDEVSASSGIACGLLKAVHLAKKNDFGMIMTEKEREKIMVAGRRVCENLPAYVLKDGSVTGVSTGTPIMPDAKAYKQIACGTTLYGQALALMALVNGNV